MAAQLTCMGELRIEQTGPFMLFQHLPMCNAGSEMLAFSEYGLSLG